VFSLLCLSQTKHIHKQNHTQHHHNIVHSAGELPEQHVCNHGELMKSIKITPNLDPVP